MARASDRGVTELAEKVRDGLHNLGNLVAALSCQAFALRKLAGGDESIAAAIDETSATILEVQQSLKQMQKDVAETPSAPAAE